MRLFPRACVASPHYLASCTGAAVLAGGGNAMDAAVATNLVLGVVTPYMCGYGGDLFAMVWDGELHGYNGSGRAPGAATVEAVRSAAGGPSLPRFGPLTVTVPGAVEAWFTLLERFGTMPFTELSETALHYAREGFPLTETAAAYIAASASAYQQGWAQAWREIYTRGGTRLVQPGLARTIEALRTEGPRAYYEGEIAAAIERTLRQHGGLMSADDLADHRGEWVRPLRTSYRGAEVFQLPPNSQGVAALEALNIIEEADIGPPGSGSREHVLIEATKLALVDRDAHITDIEHMSIDPAQLASKPWARRRRTDLDRERASAPRPGVPAAGGTIYLCAADGDGLLVSLIQSNYVGFGSGVTVDGWGINLQNRGSYFSLDPGHVNVIAPRKRTMHTLMPAMAFRDGRPWLVFGTMGGDGQAQTHVQFLTRVIDEGSDIQAAIDAPRWVVSPSHWSVSIEARREEAVVRALASRGHRITRLGGYETLMGHAHAIEVLEDGYAAATDPRAEGAATGI